jgi:glycosyltransferase involved in cell wall biosynthesis
MDKIVVIIPLLNEEKSIQIVLDELRKYHLKKIIIGLDANSSDGTLEVLKKNRVKYVMVKKRGYDPAMYEGTKTIEKFYPNIKYVLYADAGRKYSFKVVSKFLDRIKNGADLVLGVRVDSIKSMHWHQKLGTQSVILSIKFLLQKNIQDISPFRMIRYEVLKDLDMHPKKFRWTTEMLVKCLALNLRVDEVPVRTKKRIGKSKISGSIKNTFLAAIDMYSALQFVSFNLEKKVNIRPMQVKRKYE